MDPIATLRTPIGWRLFLAAAALMFVAALLVSSTVDDDPRGVTMHDVDEGPAG